MIGINKILLDACRGGNFGDVKYIHSLNVINFHANDNGPFRQAINYGHLTLAQWIYESNDKTDIDFNDIFYCACRNGYLACAKWLYSLGHITINDMHRFDENVFKASVLGGKEDICRWLWKLCADANNMINLHINNDKIFFMF